MRIVQVLTSLSFGDAIGNDTLALKKALMRMGFETYIYAESIDQRLPKDSALPAASRLAQLNEEDIIIYHLSTGTDLNYRIAESKAHLILYYHNITPPEYFEGYSLKAEENCRKGLEAAVYLADKAEYCLAVSEFNKADLRKMGYRQKIDILPILIPFDDYRKKPNKETIRKYSNDGKTNILFTGRVAPNKRHEDLIKTFYYYQKHINPDSRLILVGGYDENDRYYKRLQHYIRELQLENVIFPGHIRFDEILAYYRLADVFVCMSEHEGFCVPLVEAMQFRIPIVAYDSSAVADTLKGAGLLLEEKDPKVAAEAIYRITTDIALKHYFETKQKERIQDLSYSRIFSLFYKYISEYINTLQ